MIHDAPAPGSIAARQAADRRAREGSAVAGHIAAARAALAAVPPAIGLGGIPRPPANSTAFEAPVATEAEALAHRPSVASPARYDEVPIEAYGEGEL